MSEVLPSHGSAETKTQRAALYMRQHSQALGNLKTNAPLQLET